MRRVTVCATISLTLLSSVAQLFAESGDVENAVRKHLFPATELGRESDSALNIHFAKLVSGVSRSSIGMHTTGGKVRTLPGKSRVNSASISSNRGSNDRGYYRGYYFGCGRSDLSLLLGSLYRRWNRGEFAPAPGRLCHLRSEIALHVVPRGLSYEGTVVIHLIEHPAPLIVIVKPVIVCAMHRAIDEGGFKLFETLLWDTRCQTLFNQLLELSLIVGLHPNSGDVVVLRLGHEVRVATRKLGVFQKTTLNVLLRKLFELEDGQFAVLFSKGGF